MVTVRVRLGPMASWHELDFEEGSTVADLDALLRHECAAWMGEEGVDLTLCHDGRVLQVDERSLRAAGLLETPVIVAHWHVHDIKAQSSCAPDPGKAPTSSVEVAAPSAGPADPVDPEDEEDADAEPEELACRLCFAGPEYDSLIAPCKCIGSMRHVHTSCLNEWRTQSANPQSYFRCDQCQYVYLTERTPLADWLESRWLHRVVSAVVFVLAVALCGLLFGGVERWFYVLVEWSPASRRNPSFVQALAGPRLDRLMAGLLSVSSVGFALSARDAVRAHGGQLVPWLCGLGASVAASGVRLLRVIAVLSTVHSAATIMVEVQRRARLMLVRKGERVLEYKR